MLQEALLEQTAALFPGWEPRSILVEPIERGGSDRSFYRLRHPGAPTGSPESVILIRYGSQREENRHYVNVALFLGEVGVRVPRIFRHDEADQTIWMQDMGERDLWSYRESPWAERKSLYRAAIEEVRRLHTEGMKVFDRAPLTLQPVFDQALYHWEQEYFFDNCIERYFGRAGERDVSRCALQEIAELLASRPRVLVHRDFQSQNIMITDGNAFLIDFQGLRPGLGEYDLASLLYDPYVSLTEPERAELIDVYLEGSTRDKRDFLRTFDLCALQRLMQALGAYGFLGLMRDRPRYLSFIQPTLVSLRSVVSRISGLDELLAMLESLPRK